MKSANPTAIGAFVAGAIAIAIGAVIFFGSGALNTGNQEFVCLFRESVDGLQRGAKVTFKGVPVGTVKNIFVRFESKSGDATSSITSVPGNLPLIPVVFEVDSSRITDALGTELAESKKFHEAQVKAGLRCQLVSTSLITGLLQINLDYHPGATPPAQAPSIALDGKDYFVVPVLPSEITRLKEQAYGAINQIATLDLEKIATGLNSLLSNLNNTVENFDVDGLNASIATVQKTLSSAELDKTLEAFREAAASVGKATEALTGEVESWPVEDLLEKTASAVTSLEATLDKVNTIVSEDSGTRKEFDRSLTEFADAAREIEELAAYIKMHPSSLLWGRKDDGDEKPANSSPPPNRPRPFKRPGR